MITKNDEEITGLVKLVLSTFTRPVILTVDGPDGCGKATVTKIIYDMLTNAGINVIHIEPPFYDTLSGKIIRNYLESSDAGEIEDRRLVSEMYCFDRNRYYAHNWSHIMNTKAPAVILYNRSWLSNLFYQTTLIAPSPNDKLRQTNCIIDVHNRAGATIWTGTLACLHNMLEHCHAKGDAQYDPIYIYHSSTLKSEGYSFFNDSPSMEEEFLDGAVSAYRSARTKCVLEMADFIYRSEIDVWRTSYDPNVPFTASLPVFNYVLSPSCTKDGLSILMSNMSKRYNGDSSKNDRNENDCFLEAVMENISYINMDFDHIFSVESYMDYMKIGCYSPTMITGISDTVKNMAHAFAFHIINTTDIVRHNYVNFGSTEMVVQVDPGTVALRLLDDWLMSMSAPSTRSGPDKK